MWLYFEKLGGQKMSGKIKVSQAVAKAIETYINGCTEQVAKASLLETHAERKINSKAPKWAEINEDCAALDDLSVWQLAEILNKDYEVEKAPEEMILDEFKDLDHTFHSALDTEEQAHAEGRIKGMLYVLNIIGFKIKGVNA